MNHHKTNTLRLEFLLNELRILVQEKNVHANEILRRNPNSHIGRVLADESENFEEFMRVVIRKMYQLKWVEPEDPTQG
jgi:hypothetical protein